jgi:ADP-heptose:LPS heptosyltransferase
MRNTQDYVDNIISWDRKKGMSEFFKVIQTIRRERFDWLLDMQWVDRSALISFLSGARRKVGYHRAIPWIYDSSPGKKWDHDLPLLMRQSVVMEGLGIEDCNQFLPRISSPSQISPFESVLRITKSPLIMGIIGGSKVHKRWPVERWLELLASFQDAGWNSVLVGAGEEEEKLACRIVKPFSNEGVINLVGKLNLTELARVMSLCDAAVGGDTGPIHMASALHIPVVALYGPTPSYTAFIRQQNSVVLNCSCPDRGCGNWSCPNLDCLGDISAGSVFNSLLKLLNIQKA